MSAHEIIVFTRVLAIALPLSACSAPSKDGTTSLCMNEVTSTSDEGYDGPATTVTDGLCTDHTQTDNCCCFDDRGESACGRQNLCQLIDLRCEGEEESCSAENLAIDCPGPIDCALTALIGGHAGRIQWRVGTLMGDEEVQLHILGDGTAYVSRVSSEDVSCFYEPVVRKKLKAKDHFIQCSAAPTSFERFDCVRNALLGDSLETCTAGLNCGF